MTKLKQGLKGLWGKISKVGWSKVLFLFLMVALLASMVLSWTVFRSEKVIRTDNYHTETKIVSTDVAKLEAEKTALQEQVNKLTKQLKDIKDDVVDVPKSPAPSAAVSWTNAEALTLMRSLYPGTDKYRNPAFNSGFVYPLSWYEENIYKVPNEVLVDEEPANFISWFRSRYDVVTGFAWVSDSSGYRMVKLVPAVKDGTIGLYYIVDRTFIKVGNPSETISQYVKAIDLL